MIIFSYRLKQVRKEKRVIQEDIANILGITKTTYSRKENGLIPFTHEELIKIKGYLQLQDNEFVDIFFGEEVAFGAT